MIKKLVVLGMILCFSFGIIACGKEEEINSAGQEVNNQGNTEDNVTDDSNELMEEIKQNEESEDLSETLGDTEEIDEEDKIEVPEYPMNLPEEFIVEYKGKSCNVVGKRSFEVMEELGIEEYDTYTWNEEGETTRPIECWLGNGLISTVRVDELWDGESKVWLSRVCVGYASEDSGTSILGIKYGDSIDTICQVLGTPHSYTKNREYDIRNVSYITDYWWKDVEMYGDVFNIHVELWDDVLMELDVYQED